MSACWAAAAVLISVLVLESSTDSVVTLPQRDRLRSPIELATADVSADGRYVAFESYVRLVAADTDDARDIYVLDRLTGRVTLDSSAPDPKTDYGQPRISRDGMVLAYERNQDVHGFPRYDIVISNRREARTWTVTTDRAGAPANGPSRNPDISENGRFVAFASSATNLGTTVDTNGCVEDVYVADLADAVITRVNVDDRGVQPASGDSFAPSISADGRWVAFTSRSPLGVRLPVKNVPAGRAQRMLQVFVRDRLEAATRQISIAPGGELPDGDSWSPAISADGRYVAFVSAAANLVRTDRNLSADVFLHDRDERSVTLVSRSADGSAGNGTSTRPSVSSDGRFVAFQSDASNLVCARACPDALDDINLLWDVFLFDRLHRSMVRASQDQGGGWMETSGAPMLDGSGRVLAFSSKHPTGADDDKFDFDLFLLAWPPALPTVTGSLPGARTAPR